MKLGESQSDLQNENTDSGYLSGSEPRVSPALFLPIAFFGGQEIFPDFSSVAITDFLHLPTMALIVYLLGVLSLFLVALLPAIAINWSREHIERELNEIVELIIQQKEGKFTAHFYLTTLESQLRFFNAIDGIRRRRGIKLTLETYSIICGMRLFLNYYQEVERIIEEEIPYCNFTPEEAEKHLRSFAESYLTAKFTKRDNIEKAKALGGTFREYWFLSIFANQPPWNQIPSEELSRVGQEINLFENLNTVCKLRKEKGKEYLDREMPHLAREEFQAGLTLADNIYDYMVYLRDELSSEANQDDVKYVVYYAGALKAEFEQLLSELPDVDEDPGSSNTALPLMMIFLMVLFFLSHFAEKLQAGWAKVITWFRATFARSTLEKMNETIRNSGGSNVAEDAASLLPALPVGGKDKAPGMAKERLDEPLFFGPASLIREGLEEFIERGQLEKFAQVDRLESALRQRNLLSMGLSDDQQQGQRRRIYVGGMLEECIWGKVMHGVQGICETHSRDPLSKETLEVLMTDDTLVWADASDPATRCFGKEPSNLLYLNALRQYNVNYRVYDANADVINDETPNSAVPYYQLSIRFFRNIDQLVVYLENTAVAPSFWGLPSLGLFVPINYGRDILDGGAPVLAQADKSVAVAVAVICSLLTLLLLFFLVKRHFGRIFSFLKVEFPDYSSGRSTLAEELARLLNQGFQEESKVSGKPLSDKPPIFLLTGDVLTPVRNALDRSGYFRLSLGSASEAALGDFAAGVAEEIGLGVSAVTWDVGAFPAMSRMTQPLTDALPTILISGAPSLKGRPGFWQRLFGSFDHLKTPWHMLTDEDAKYPDYDRDMRMAKALGFITIEVGRLPWYAYLFFPFLLLRHLRMTLPEFSFYLPSWLLRLSSWIAPTGAEQIRLAIELARIKRRPVFLKIPLDIATQRTAASLTPIIRRRKVSPWYRWYLNRLAGKIVRKMTQSKNPVIYAGSKFSRDPHLLGLLKGFSKDTGIPIACAWAAKGLFDARDMDLIGTYAGRITPWENTRRYIEEEADFILRLGDARLPFLPESGAGTYFPERMKAKQMRFVGRDSFPQGQDIQLLLEAMQRQAQRQRLEKEFARKSLGLAEIPTQDEINLLLEKKVNREDLVGILDWVCNEIEVAPRLPDRAKPESEWLREAVHLEVAPSTFWFLAQRMLHPVFSDWRRADIGAAVGRAAGVAIANPSKFVISVTGDGGFLAHGMPIILDLAKTRTRLVTIVLQDNAYTLGSAPCGLTPEGKVALTTFHDGSRDFAEIAKTLGAQAFCVPTHGELIQALKLAQKYNGPTVIVLPVENDQKVYREIAELQRQVNSAKQVEGVDWGDFLEINLSVMPQAGLSPPEQLADCAMQAKRFLSEKAKIVKQTVFLPAENNSQYRQLKSQLQTKLAEIYGKDVPPTSFLGQTPLENVAVACEYVIIAPKHKGVTIEYKDIEGVRYSVVMPFGMVVGAGITDEYKTDILAQSEAAFALMKKILTAEGLNFTDIKRQWNYIEQITALTPEGKQHYQVFNDLRSRNYREAGLTSNYPAATGIGQNTGGIILECIAYRTASKRNFIAQGIKNLRQISAFEYSQRRLEGEVSAGLKQRAPPAFSRGYVVLKSKTPAWINWLRICVIFNWLIAWLFTSWVGRFYVSGTASILDEYTQFVSVPEAFQVLGKKDLGIIFESRLSPEEHQQRFLPLLRAQEVLRSEPALEEFARDISVVKDTAYPLDNGYLWSVVTPQSLAFLHDEALPILEVSADKGDWVGGNVRKQTETTLNNIEYLSSFENIQHPDNLGRRGLPIMAGATLQDLLWVRTYVKLAEDKEKVEEVLRQRLGEVSIDVVADVCRVALSVEIEGDAVLEVKRVSLFKAVAIILGKLAKFLKWLITPSSPKFLEFLTEGIASYTGIDTERLSAEARKSLREEAKKEDRQNEPPTYPLFVPEDVQKRFQERPKGKVTPGFSPAIITPYIRDGFIPLGIIGKFGITRLDLAQLMNLSFAGMPSNAKIIVTIKENLLSDNSGKVCIATVRPIKEVIPVCHTDERAIFLHPWYFELARDPNLRPLINDLWRHEAKELKTGSHHEACQESADYFTKRPDEFSAFLKVIKEKNLVFSEDYRINLLKEPLDGGYFGWRPQQSLAQLRDYAARGIFPHRLLPENQLHLLPDLQRKYEGYFLSTCLAEALNFLHQQQAKNAPVYAPPLQIIDSPSITFGAYYDGESLFIERPLINHPRYNLTRIFVHELNNQSHWRNKFRELRFVWQQVYNWLATAVRNYLQRRKINRIIRDAFAKEPKLEPDFDATSLNFGPITRFLGASRQFREFGFCRPYDRFAQALKKTKVYVYLFSRSALASRGLWEMVKLSDDWEGKEWQLSLYISREDEEGGVLSEREILGIAVHEILAAISAKVKCLDPRTQRLVLRPTSHRTNWDAQEHFLALYDRDLTRSYKRRGDFTRFSDFRSELELLGYLSGRVDFAAEERAPQDKRVSPWGTSPSAQACFDAIEQYPEFSQEFRTLGRTLFQIAMVRYLFENHRIERFPSYPEFVGLLRALPFRERETMRRFAVTDSVRWQTNRAQKETQIREILTTLGYAKEEIERIILRIDTHERAKTEPEGMLALVELFQRERRQSQRQERSLKHRLTSFLQGIFWRGPPRAIFQSTFNSHQPAGTRWSRIHYFATYLPILAALLLPQNKNVRYNYSISLTLSEELRLYTRSLTQLMANGPQATSWQEAEQLARAGNLDRDAALILKPATEWDIDDVRYIHEIRSWIAIPYRKIWPSFACFWDELWQPGGFCQQDFSEIEKKWDEEKEALQVTAKALLLGLNLAFFNRPLFATGPTLLAGIPVNNQPVQSFPQDQKVNKNRAYFTREVDFCPFLNATGPEHFPKLAQDNQACAQLIYEMTKAMAIFPNLVALLSFSNELAEADTERRSLAATVRRKSWNDTSGKYVDWKKRGRIDFSVTPHIIASAWTEQEKLVSKGEGHRTGLYTLNRPEDVEAQVILAKEHCQEVYGQRMRWIWNAEANLDPLFAEILAKQGIQLGFVGREHFFKIREWHFGKVSEELKGFKDSLRECQALAYPTRYGPFILCPYSFEQKDIDFNWGAYRRRPDDLLAVDDFIPWEMLPSRPTDQEEAEKLAQAVEGCAAIPINPQSATKLGYSAWLKMITNFTDSENCVHNYITGSMLWMQLLRTIAGLKEIQILTAGEILNLLHQLERKGEPSLLKIQRHLTDKTDDFPLGTWSPGASTRDWVGGHPGHPILYGYADRAIKSLLSAGVPYWRAEGATSQTNEIWERAIFGGVQVSCPYWHLVPGESKERNPQGYIRDFFKHLASAYERAWQLGYKVEPPLIGNQIPGFRIWVEGEQIERLLKEDIPFVQEMVDQAVVGSWDWPFAGLFNPDKLLQERAVRSFSRLTQENPEEARQLLAGLLDREKFAYHYQPCALLLSKIDTASYCRLFATAEPALMREEKTEDLAGETRTLNLLDEHLLSLFQYDRQEKEGSLAVEISLSNLVPLREWMLACPQSFLELTAVVNSPTKPALQGVAEAQTRLQTFFAQLRNNPDDYPYFLKIAQLVCAWTDKRSNTILSKLIFPLSSGIVEWDWQRKYAEIPANGALWIGNPCRFSVQAKRREDGAEKTFVSWWDIGVMSHRNLIFGLTKGEYELNFYWQEAQRTVGEGSISVSIPAFTPATVQDFTSSDSIRTSSLQPSATVPQTNTSNSFSANDLESKRVALGGTSPRGYWFYHSQPVLLWRLKRAIEKRDLTTTEYLVTQLKQRFAHTHVVLLRNPTDKLAQSAEVKRYEEFIDAVIADLSSFGVGKNNRGRVWWILNEAGIDIREHARDNLSSAEQDQEIFGVVGITFIIRPQAVDFCFFFQDNGGGVDLAQLLADKIAIDQLKMLGEPKGRGLRTGICFVFKNFQVPRCCIFSQRAKLLITGLDADNIPQGKVSPDNTVERGFRQEIRATIPRETPANPSSGFPLLCLAMARKILRSFTFLERIIYITLRISLTCKPKKDRIKGGRDA